MKKTLEEKLVTVKKHNRGKESMENTMRQLERLDVMQGAIFRKEVVTLPDDNLITVSFSGKDFEIDLYLPEVDLTMSVSSDGKVSFSAALGSQEEVDSLMYYFMSCTLWLKDNNILDQIDMDHLWKVILSRE